MRSGIRVVNFVFLTAAGLFAACALPAQSLTPCIRSVFFSVEPEPLLGARGKLSYTALITKTFEFKLADGNSIHWTLQAMQAHDENGRTMRQHIEGCNIDNSGQPQLRIRTSIYDLAAKTDISWSMGPGSVALTTISHSRLLTQPNWNEIARVPYPRDPHPEITNEDLGTRTIAGMEATGRRRTEVIPAGRDGNDLPLKLMTETWTSVKDHIMLMMVTDNPRMGRSSWEITNLSLGPPDPALFTPPADYRVWDQEPQSATEAKPQ
jgi:hypothetical protein